MLKKDPKHRFESKFNKTNECWNWNAAVGSSGYGHFWMDGKPIPSNRASYKIYIGEIPNGNLVLHKCDNRLCVNPNHLFLGSNQDNMKDMVTKNRQAKGILIKASKLTPEQILKIRSDIRSQRKIAHDYGVSHTTIGDIKNNKYWSHIK